MVELIESNPEILGGKPVIKGTKIQVSLIFELINLNYSINQIIEEYSTLSREILLQLIELGEKKIMDIAALKFLRTFTSESEITHEEAEKLGYEVSKSLNKHYKCK